MAAGNSPSWWGWYSWPSWWHQLNGVGRITWKIDLAAGKASIWDTSGITSGARLDIRAHNRPLFERISQIRERVETIPKRATALWRLVAGAEPWARFERFGLRKNLPFRLRSANLETSKSRGLNSEAQTSKRIPPLLRLPNCLSEPLALRIKPLEFKNEAQGCTPVACRCSDGYTFDFAPSAGICRFDNEPDAAGRELFKASPG